METVIHPVTGEKGYFVSVTEKRVIDVVVDDYLNQNSSLTGVGDEL